MTVQEEDQIVIVGGGPVGLTTALLLAQARVPVTVLEKNAGVARDYRASTFHAGTLDLLEECGITQALVERGLRCPVFQYRSWTEGKIAEFDHALLADDSRHPYRIQCEQFKLSEYLKETLERMAGVRLLYGHEVTSMEADGDGVCAHANGPGGAVAVRGAFLVGADGGHSVVRKHLDIPFEGFTYPERILVLGTTFDFRQVFPDLALINYLSDPENYAHILRIPDLWRISLPIKDEVSDETARTDAFIEARLAPLMPGIRASEIPVRGVYHVHQRVAARYREGRVFLAGDAAHLNNPKGGMGLNGGLHDAYSLAGRLAQARSGDADILDGYEAQRRPEAIQAIHRQTEKNYRALKEGGAAGRQSQFDEWRAIEADPARARELLLDTSMINSLRRCGLLPQPAQAAATE